MMNPDDLPLDDPAEDPLFLNPDDLPLYEPSEKASLTPAQEIIAAQTISALQKLSADLHQDLLFFAYGDVGIPPPHGIISAVNQALNLTEQDAEQKSLSVLCCIRRELGRQMGLFPILSNHSIMLNAPMAEPPAFTIKEHGLDPGASSVLFRFMSGSSRAALAQTSRSNRSAIAPLLVKKIQDSIRQNHFYFAVLRAPMKSDAPLSTLVKMTRLSLKTEKILLFPTYLEAVIFSGALSKSDHRSNPNESHYYPVVCLAALGDEKPIFQRLNLAELPAPVECNFANPRDYAALTTELTSSIKIFGDPIHCYRHAFLKTRYDGHPHQAIVQVPQKKSPFTRFNRNAAHKKFMESMPHRPLTPHDLMRWLEEFYCDQYLPHKKNGDLKRLALKARLADIRKAEQSGLDLGISLTKFLEISPLHELSLKDLIQHERLQLVQTWGWKIINEWFLQPQNNEVEELKHTI